MKKVRFEEDEKKNKERRKIMEKKIDCDKNYETEEEEMIEDDSEYKCEQKK